MRGNHIGEFEELVLMSVAALDGSAYGLTVRELLLDQTGRKVSLGAVHATLYRLQDKGLLNSGLKGATQQRGGRRKRIYTVSSAGLATIGAVRESRERIWNLMPRRLRSGVAT